jgi:hypothetical protein
MRLARTIFKIGDKITVNGKIGEIVYVNRQLKCYQVRFEGKREALISFDVVEKEKAAN